MRRQAAPSSRGLLNLQLSPIQESAGYSSATGSTSSGGHLGGRARRVRKRIRNKKHRSRLVYIPACSIVLLTALLVFTITSNTSYDQHQHSGANQHRFSLPLLRKGHLQQHYPPYYPEFEQFEVELPPEIRSLCTKTFWHTIETTTIVLPDGQSFVHTGDIDDLWLRDSAAQVHTLLLPYSQNRSSFVQRDPKLRRVVQGLIRRVAFYIRHDPYANAFRIDTSYKFSAAQKALGRHDFISTWNYEVDSNCYFLRMLYFYWKQLPDDPTLREEPVHEAIRITVDLWKAEQKHEEDSFPTGPLFDCQNCNKPYRYKELPRDGKGSETNPSAGLTWTGFRPSDDASTYHYNIPSNMFAVVALDYAAALALELWSDGELARDAMKLRDDIHLGIEKYGVVEHERYGKIYAYEVDGLGNALFMDDANVPSLLSLPYLGYTYDETIYENTRRFLYSKDNPYYHRSRDRSVEGIGSPHTQHQIRNGIWPMSVAIRGLGSKSVEEKLSALQMLANTTGGTGWMHESINVDNPKKYTRWWFCWVDSLFAELAMSLSTKCPDPSYQYKILEWRDPVTLTD